LLLLAGNGLVPVWSQSATQVENTASGQPRLAVLALQAAGVTSLPAPEEIPPALIGEAIALLFFAVVPGADNEALWQARELQYTIPGTPVSVRMVGSEAIIVVSVTPYRSVGEQLMLVTQGQVWFKEDDGTMRYRTSFDTINMSYGERVFFYPFGVQEDGSTALRLEMVVDSYALLQAAWAKTGALVMPPTADAAATDGTGAAVKP